MSLASRSPLTGDGLPSDMSGVVDRVVVIRRMNRMLVLLDFLAERVRCVYNFLSE